jgi:hypothetical protein
VVEELLNRAAHNAYDPVRYAVPGPAPRRLRAVPARLLKELAEYADVYRAAVL